MVTPAAAALVIGCSINAIDHIRFDIGRRRSSAVNDLFRFTGSE